LLVLGVLGFILPGGQLLGDQLFFDGAENIAHTILGIVALIAAYVLSVQLQKWLVIVVGVVALITTVAGFIVVGAANPNLGVTNLEVLDDILHLVVGVWALWAALRPMPAAEMAPRPAIS